MSRYYSMSVTITGASPDRIEKIKLAAEDEWPFDDWYEDGNGGLTASAEDTLGGGEGEDEFAQRLAKAIWQANGAACDIEVRATYLEELPYEAYFFDEEEYNRLMKSAEEAVDNG